CFVNFTAAPRTSYDTLGSVLPASETCARNKMLCDIRVLFSGVRCLPQCQKTNCRSLVSLGMTSLKIYLLIHSAISRAICSAGRSLTTRVWRCCFGGLALRKCNPPAGSGTDFAFCSAGITVRMFAIPTCGLLRGSGRLQVAQPNKAGGPGHTET